MIQRFLRKLGIRGGSSKIVCVILNILLINGCLYLTVLYKKNQESNLPPFDECRNRTPDKIPRTLVNLQNFEYIYTPKDVCCFPQNFTIVILVHSARRNFVSRQIIRSTYGQIKTYQKYTIHTIFSIGLGTRCEDDRIQLNLKKESDEYGDLLLGNFLDSYRNISYKHMMGYKWAVEECPGADFYVKADDDNLVNVFNLIRLLDTIDENDEDIYCTANHIQPIWRDKESIWYVTPEEMEGELYPPYCGLAVYTSRIQVTKRILAASTKFKFFWVEDVYATGYLRREANQDKSQMTINLIPAPVINFEENLDLFHPNRTIEWIGLLVPRDPPPYLMCQLWEEVLRSRNLTGIYGSSCDSIV